MRTPSDPSEAHAWRGAGLALALLLLALHLLGAWNAAGNADFWRDVYWANEIAHGRQFPLGGPPIYGLMQLGPWWFYLLAAPLALTHQVVAVALLVQFLAGLKYLLAWRFGLATFGGRFAFLFTAALAFAGWSTIPLLYPTHTALVETTLLLLALHGLRCWTGFGWGRALGFGLLAAASVHAHPSTVALSVLLGVALMVRHPVPGTVLKVGVAALVTLATLAPPFLQGAEVAQASSQAFGRYLGEDLGVAWWLRVPKLAVGLVGGGAWHGMLLETQWRLDVVEAVNLVFLAAVLVALEGAVARARAPSPERAALLAALAVLLAQICFLVWIRPITPLWMGVQLVPALAFVLALGWEAQLWRGTAARVSSYASVAAFLAVSLVPFGWFLRQFESVRGPAEANPYMDMAARSERFVTVPIAFTNIRALQDASGALCDGATLHGTLAYAIEHSFETTVEAACGARPALGYRGVAPGTHVLGYGAKVWRAIEAEPGETRSGIGLSRAVTAIAPASGGHLAPLERMQVNPEHAGEAPRCFPLEFRARGSDLVAINNRFRFVAPLGVLGAEVPGHAVRLVHSEVDAAFYRCTDCGAGEDVSWRLELEGIAPHADVVLLRTP